jgi:hypothetical protein
MSDIHLNLDPKSARMQLRHLCRIQRLRQSMTKPRMSEHRDTLRKEIEQRTVLLAQNGIEVPEGDPGLEALITKFKDSGGLI